MGRESGGAIQQTFRPDEEGEFSRNLVFVIMPFIADMDGVFRSIQDGCAGVGLHAKRADDSPGSGFVLREITELIEQAEFLIVDLTGERPNVYYELGYAHGVGNRSEDILLIAREGTTLHFDIAPIRVRFYSSLEELSELIRRHLGEMIRATRRGR